MLCSPVSSRIKIAGILQQLPFSCLGRSAAIAAVDGIHSVEFSGTKTFESKAALLEGKPIERIDKLTRVLRFRMKQ